MPVAVVHADGEAAKRETVHRWAHVMAELDAGGKIRLWIDGKPLADTPQAGHLVRRPADGISAEPGSTAYALR